MAAKRPRQERFLLLLLLSALGLTLPATVAALAIGEQVDPQTLEDQFGEPLALNKDTRWMVFVPDKAASEIVHAVLRQRPAAYLADRRIAYLAGISRMPGLVTRILALPKMRTYSYRIMLVRDQTAAAGLPAESGSVSVPELQDLRVVAIHHATSVAQLSQNLAQ